MYRTALITGASAGIGAEFARQLAARGSNLILVARRKERLEALAAELHQKYIIQAKTLPADLSQSAEIEQVEACIAESPTLDLLVNNAGFGVTERFSQGSLTPQMNMLQVHVLASVRLSRSALTGMINRKQGAIINVASVAAFLPYSSVMYPATKAFLVAFSQALHHELHSQGIRVQALCPGFTYTEFHDVASKDRSVVPKFLWMSAEQVVRASLKALPRGQVICVPGWHYRLITSLARIPLTASIIQFFASQTAIRRRIRP